MTRRRPSSARWLQEHREDPYVAAAKRDGYRSRAAYKLLELQTYPQEHRPLAHPTGLLLQPGMTVVDLGAAPGGWSQVAAQLVAPKGRVLAIDLLPMAPIPGVECVEGDFLDESVLLQLHTLLAADADSRVADVILSDMAPNMSGIPSVDQARGELLAESAFQFAEATLRPGGNLVLKIFQGSSFHTIVAHARQMFARVKLIKPRASRDRSPEQYLLGLGFHHSPLLPTELKLS
ncbi:RlmE family RNA methyltransferase [Candidatus Magnetaquicoccus inordinatus]|uniref:RlmE family RNA methyltransferase n=1 Tax=Candidatus Magnetaquicoccus inordinatus TaxID=2496818 RepID=UPI00102B945C|nr:RlmE family RNA methyltransferase [Candidatus Magnetaquicoccus inordinatus]